MSLSELCIECEFFKRVCAGVQRKWKQKKIIHPLSQPSIYLPVGGFRLPVVLIFMSLFFCDQ